MDLHPSRLVAVLFAACAIAATSCGGDSGSLLGAPPEGELMALPDDGPGSGSVPVLDVDGFVAVSANVATAGQPTPEQFAAAKAAGYGTIINVRTATEGAGDEQALVEAAGLRYVHLPIRGSDLCARHADALADAVVEAGGQPVLVHGSSGNRAGALWAVYRARHFGASPDAALAAGERAGLTNRKLRRFVERLLRQGL